MLGGKVISKYPLSPKKQVLNKLKKMNFTIKQSNQNPIFKKLKNFSYSCLIIEPRVNFIEIKRDKNPQKVFLNPKEKKFK
ncbi:hypothetical protein VN0558_06140 [Helicobacter pylori]